jgi:methylated-DNA-[protein]-cysteine S-methyltransferase
MGAAIVGTTVSTADHHLERRLREPIALPGDAWEQLQARLVERAEREGLLDVAYARVDSPLGRLLVAATVNGVVRLAYENEAADAVLDELAARVSPRLFEAPARLDGARRELEEYFNGQRTRFQLPLDWALSTGFRRRVLQATAGIHYGATATYRTVATKAGSPRAVRAAGSALATNPIPLLVPCHRVVRSDGGLGGYRGGLGRKAELLRLEAGR